MGDDILTTMKILIIGESGVGKSRYVPIINNVLYKGYCVGRGVPKNFINN